MKATNKLGKIMTRFNINGVWVDETDPQMVNQPLREFIVALDALCQKYNVAISTDLDQVYLEIPQWVVPSIGCRLGYDRMSGTLTAWQD
jgi:hypothetical protein